VGGLPQNPSPPYNYKAPFSPIDVIEEYTRPARMMINSKIVTKPALSEIEILDILDVGKLEAFNTDGLRSLLSTMSHIPNMKEKTLRYPGHAQLMQSLLDQGLFNKNRIKETSNNLFKDWKLGKNEKEFTVLDINIHSAAKNIHYHLYDEFNDNTQSSSMARTTGYTATATINMLANNLWDKKGVHPPENVGSSKKCIDFLFQYFLDRKISLSVL
jgi:saccharopine dehydrogenase-like NADP-dependent oxidoreductase